MIIEEGDPLSGTVRLHVIWSSWPDLSARERSELIVNAYERAHGRARALLVKSALGFTPSEAAQMGIRYA